MFPAVLYNLIKVFDDLMRRKALFNEKAWHF